MKFCLCILFGAARILIAYFTEYSFNFINIKVLSHTYNTYHVYHVYKKIIFPFQKVQ